VGVEGSALCLIMKELGMLPAQKVCLDYLGHIARLRESLSTIHSRRLSLGAHFYFHRMLLYEVHLCSFTPTRLEHASPREPFTHIWQPSSLQPLTSPAFHILIIVPTSFFKVIASHVIEIGLRFPNQAKDVDPAIPRDLMIRRDETASPRHPVTQGICLYLKSLASMLSLRL
jgi:hypothetical protein